MGISGQYGPGHTSPDTPPRGMRATLPRKEATALDLMHAALMACNAVEPWALHADDYPYGAVHYALKLALTDLYGPGEADRIVEETHRCGETPSHVICELFGISVHD